MKNKTEFLYVISLKKKYYTLRFKTALKKNHIREELLKVYERIFLCYFNYFSSVILM